MQGLISALQKQMAAGGPAGAVGVCSDLAPSIAGRISRETGTHPLCADACFSHLKMLSRRISSISEQNVDRIGLVILTIKKGNVPNRAHSPEAAGHSSWNL